MKYALVTGGTRGIGLATASLLFGRGYAVTATYSKDEESAEHARKSLSGVKFVRADVSSEEEMKKVIESLPALDLLVCNAGVASFSQVQDVSEEELVRVLSVNVKGTILCCKHAVKKLLAREGSVVTVSSIWGQTGGSCESVYSASKGAVIAFTKALAKELAPMKVRVNCVAPGVVKTSMNSRLSEEEKEALKQEIPLGTFVSPSEVAEAILFLAEQRSITGQVLSVNGGLYI